MFLILKDCFRNQGRNQSGNKPKQRENKNKSEQTRRKTGKKSKQKNKVKKKTEKRLKKEKGAIGNIIIWIVMNQASGHKLSTERWEERGYKLSPRKMLHWKSVFRHYSASFIKV